MDVGRTPGATTARQVRQGVLPQRSFGGLPLAPFAAALLVGVGVACTALRNLVGYMDLTAFELCTSVIVFCWIALLVRFLDALALTVPSPAAGGASDDDDAGITQAGLPISPLSLVPSPGERPTRGNHRDGPFR